MQLTHIYFQTELQHQGLLMLKQFSKLSIGTNLNAEWAGPNQNQPFLFSLLYCVIIPAQNQSSYSFANFEHAMFVTISLWLYLECIQKQKESKQKVKDSYFFPPKYFKTFWKPYFIASFRSLLAARLHISGLLDVLGLSWNSSYLGAHKNRNSVFQKDVTESFTVNRLEETLRPTQPLGDKKVYTLKTKCHEINKGV